MGRICAAIGCPNSTFKLGKWYTQLCEVHGLTFGSCVCKPPFQLFPFPTKTKDTEARKRWTKLINRKTKGGSNWQPTSESRICSAHFKESEPTASFPDPTENLGYDISNPSFAPKRKLPRNPPTCRLPYSGIPKRKYTKTDKTEEVSTSKSDDRKVEYDLSEIEYVQLPANKMHTDHDYVDVIQSKCEGCSEKDIKLKKMKGRIKKLEQSLKVSNTKNQNKNVCHKVLKSDMTTRNFTGIVTKAQFETLFSYLEPKVAKMRYWTGSKKESRAKSSPRGKRTPKKPGPARTLSIKEEFILVLMKLRMTLTVAFLGSLFNISSSTASQIFNTWVKVLSSELGPLIFWPDKQTILENMPGSMKKKYRTLRCTLDCTEVFIGRPRNLELQALTWSDYKKHNTIKFLVAIAPNGMITFISKAWGGRASDVHITRESGFLDLLDPGDIILADRGFTIKEDLLLKQAKLEIPPPSKGREQQEPQEVKKTKKIANARIHVERAIGRMKWFGILKETLPITLIPLADDIITVCAALVNLLPPLVSE